MRFNFDANTKAEAREYLCNRALQMAHAGARLEEIEDNEYGLWARFTYRARSYYAYYLLAKHRGKGRYLSEYKKKCEELHSKIKIITTTPCKIVSYLGKHKIPFEVCNGLIEEPEYQAIEFCYEDRKANRSGVYLMNHIDEGLYILYRIKASRWAHLAYIIHPMFQPDKELDLYFNVFNEKLQARSVLLTMEYRSVANEYLSKREIKNIEEIRLSPLKEVNDMLIADKIQNYKDFLRYHHGTHERSPELSKYFKNWFERLGVTFPFYEDIQQELFRIAEMPIQKLRDTFSQTS